MHGGLERWKRGTGSRGVRQAIGYALEGTCDSHLRHMGGDAALESYARTDETTVTRFVCLDGRTGRDELDAAGLRRWVNGEDPFTGEARGVPQLLATSDLILDGTINAPEDLQHRRAPPPGTRTRVRRAAGSPARPHHPHLAARAQRSPRARRIDPRGAHPDRGRRAQAPALASARSPHTPAPVAERQGARRGRQDGRRSTRASR